MKLVNVFRFGHHGAMRVLVVEDNLALGTIVERGLREDGYAIDLVSTLADATHQVDTCDYDMMLLDLGLPDGDGTQLCEEVRRRGSAMPIIILTARDDLGDKVRGLDAGADDYVTKPFDLPELTARMRALLRRPVDYRNTEIEVGDIVLDPSTHNVTRAGIGIPLTSREFALAEYLMRHAGEVLSRTDLLEHVWDANYDGLSNVVDVHIANLRRKLDQPGAAPVISTVRGVGYRFETLDDLSVTP